MSYNNSTPHSEIFHYGYSTNTSTYHYIQDGGSLNGDDSNFWSSSPRSDSPSPTNNVQNPLVGSYSYFAGTSNKVSSQQRLSHYRNTYTPNTCVADETLQHVQVPFVRVVKRRTTANKKERRRTQSINNAYADLRDCIPNVPPDTKLSKIKTLRLATSYINYLVKALESDDPAPGSFTAELGTMSKKSTNNTVNECTNEQISSKGDIGEDMIKTRKAKGRTGWPQHVWALELEQEQAL
ncbi:heart- and neural crest derivatives-expressed protein 2-like isoform X1 [Tribolium madens]|uniref:heart- and neural crest derivatives-expressed protein 2-like isoform X1 n=1 Tax=Tribolium madens TaxID=41895 RepID=UPI001CF73B97|nr:heart- and neural crest derivatives-expressed protein 2-like isoform X1 [Tribolium madens]